MSAPPPAVPAAPPAPPASHRPGAGEPGPCPHVGLVPAGPGDAERLMAALGADAEVDLLGWVVDAPLAVGPGEVEVLVVCAERCERALAVAGRSAVPVVAVVPSPRGHDLVRLLQAGVRGVVAAGDEARCLRRVAAAVADGGYAFDHALDRRLCVLVARHRLRRTANTHGLTARQLDVLSLLPEGLSNREVAERLGITVDTVKQHVSTLIDRLGVTDRREAVAVAVRRGLAGDRR